MASSRHGISLQLANAGIGSFVRSLPTLECLEHFKLVHRVYVKSNEPVQLFVDALMPLFEKVDFALGYHSLRSLGEMEVQAHVLNPSVEVCPFLFPHWMFTGFPQLLTVLTIGPTLVLKPLQLTYLIILGQRVLHCSTQLTWPVIIPQSE